MVIVIIYTLAFSIVALDAVTKHAYASNISNTTAVSSSSNLPAIQGESETTGGERGTGDSNLEATGGTISVEEEIRQIAKEANFEWVEYLVKLAKCESSLNPNAINTQNNSPSGSKDRGLWQINDYWHPEVSDEVAFDVRLSTEWTMWRINSGYQAEWVCDRYI